MGTTTDGISKILLHLQELKYQSSIDDGKLMAEIRPEQLGWDGLHKGHKLPADDYWFKVNYDGLIDPADTVVWKEFIGHFSLRR